jgi:hypothetical protein
MEFWCEDCTKWVPEGDVREEVRNPKANMTETVYYHEMCGKRAVPADEW